jgi:hypothetical protein
VTALTPRLRAIQWPPNFKVSNVDKYEPKQDPGGWLAVYTTAARAAGASEDVMTAYLPIVLGQDALQWLRHLPRHCIDDWSDFSRRFTANFQSLSDKPAQPWDLKSIKRRGDETLRSYLKRFQTMRNRIPEVTEAAVIEDFYRGSNDSAFVRAILQKAPTTSEQLFREADLYITADERAQDLIGGAKPAPAAPLRDANQQPDKRWEKRPREEVHDTPCGTAGTSSTPSDTADLSNLYLLLCRGEDQKNHDNPSSRRRGKEEPSHALTWRSMSSLADTGCRRTEDNKSSTIARYWWRPLVLPLRTGGRSTRSPSLGPTNGSTSTTQANTRSSSIR